MIWRRRLHMPLISLPLANHDDNQHAPNENLRLGHFFQGISTMLMVCTASPRALKLAAFPPGRRDDAGSTGV